MVVEKKWTTAAFIFKKEMNDMQLHHLGPNSEIVKVSPHLAINFNLFRDLKQITKPNTQNAKLYHESCRHQLILMHVMAENIIHSPFYLFGVRLSHSVVHLFNRANKLFSFFL